MISALGVGVGGLKQEDGEFKANLSYMARPCLNK